MKKEKVTNSKKNEKKEEQTKSKKKIIIAIIVLLVIVGVILGYIKILKPHLEAIEDYNKVVEVIEKQNDELDSKIKKIQNLIDSNEKVIDENIVTKAKEVTKKAGASKFIVDDRPVTTKNIIKETEKMSTPPDYTEIFEELDNTYVAYDTSIKQYKQLTNPSEEFVIQRLQTVDEIVDVRAVTEDNDPNGNLNKPGGYTATVYFESKKVDQSKVYGTTLIDKGTDAGGAIEVYAKEEDAKKREEYLAGFDGSILVSGTHKVVGTVLIRTSNELTATQQKKLEAKIIKALSELK